MTGKVIHPNNLRAMRLAQQPKPWTQDRVVYELERLGRELRIPVASRRSLKVQVSRWENGHIEVGENYRVLFRRIYKATDEQLGFVKSGAGGSAASVLAPVPFKGTWDAAFDLAAQEWKTDLERRDFLKGAAYVTGAASVPALQWLLGQPEPVTGAGSGVAIGPEHIESIREMTATFRRLDNRFGGAHARESVLRFLSADVAPLVKSGRYGEATGAALLSATAEMMQLAGWMTYDAGLHAGGEHYMTQALRLSLAAGDQALGAEILAALSHQASYLRDGSTAIDLARAAQKTAREHGLGALLAESLVMEAHGHACAGDEAACAKALSAAETALDRADRSADPQWIGYFDEAYLSAKFGHCFKELRQPEQAQRFAERSLDMDNSYLRGRAFNLSLLATAHAQAGQVDEACVVGSEALTLVKGMRSARATEYIRGLRRELEPYADAPAVQTFCEGAGALR